MQKLLNEDFNLDEDQIDLIKAAAGLFAAVLCNNGQVPWSRPIRPESFAMFTLNAFGAAKTRPMPHVRCGTFRPGHARLKTWEGGGVSCFISGLSLMK